MLCRHSVGTFRGHELTSNSSVNTRPQSSQLVEPLWTDPGVKSKISVQELIFSLKKKKKKKKSAGGESANLPQKPSQRGKRHTTTTTAMTTTTTTTLVIVDLVGVVILCYPILLFVVVCLSPKHVLLCLITVSDITVVCMVLQFPWEGYKLCVVLSFLCEVF